MPISCFDLVADSTRRRLLDELRLGECAVGALVERLRMSQPAISKHLRILREAGLALVRVDAQRRLYRLNPEALKEIDQWLAPYRDLWEGTLSSGQPVQGLLEDHGEWNAHKGWRKSQPPF